MTSKIVRVFFTPSPSIALVLSSSFFLCVCVGRFPMFLLVFVCVFLFNSKNKIQWNWKIIHNNFFSVYFYYSFFFFFLLFTFLCNFNTLRSVSELTSYVLYVRFDTNFFFYCSLLYFQSILDCMCEKRRKNTYMYIYIKKNSYCRLTYWANDGNIIRYQMAYWTDVYCHSQLCMYTSNILGVFLSDRADIICKILQHTMDWR